MTKRKQTDLGFGEQRDVVSKRALVSKVVIEHDKFTLRELRLKCTDSKKKTKN
jgi:hypothetical protein